jgi:hypothetical protein
MNTQVRELIAISLMATFCTGVAVALEKELLAAVFAAMGAVAGIAAIRRWV